MVYALCCICMVVSIEIYARQCEVFSQVCKHTVCCVSYIRMVFVFIVEVTGGIFYMVAKMLVLIPLPNDLN